MVKPLKKCAERMLKLFDFILLLMVVLVILNFVGVKTPLANYQSLAVLSDSMAPTFSAGDLVITQKTPSKELATGDIISVTINGETVTHRIAEIQKNGEKRIFITKGDGNNYVDQPVYEQQLLGKMIVSIPKLGRIGQMTSQTRGKILLIATIINLWLWLYFFSLILKTEKGEMTNEEMV